jgi:hypothetical protein
MSPTVPSLNSRRSLVTDHSCADDNRQVVLARASTVALSSVQWLASPGSFPVRHDLILAQLGPLPNKLQRPRLQTPGKDFAVH